MKNKVKGRRFQVEPSPFFASALHVLAEKARNGLGELVFRFACVGFPFGADKDHKPQRVPVLLAGIWFGIVTNMVWSVI